MGEIEKEKADDAVGFFEEELSISERLKRRRRRTDEWEQTRNEDD